MKQILLQQKNHSQTPPPATSPGTDGQDSFLKQILLQQKNHPQTPPQTLSSAQGTTLTPNANPIIAPQTASNTPAPANSNDNSALMPFLGLLAEGSPGPSTGLPGPLAIGQNIGNLGEAAAQGFTPNGLSNSAISSSNSPTFSDNLNATSGAASGVSMLGDITSIILAGKDFHESRMKMNQLGKNATKAQKDIHANKRTNLGVGTAMAGGDLVTQSANIASLLEPAGSVASTLAGATSGIAGAAVGTAVMVQSSVEAVKGMHRWSLLNNLTTKMSKDLDANAQFANGAKPDNDSDVDGEESGSGDLVEDVSADLEVDTDTAKDMLQSPDKDMFKLALYIQKQKGNKAIKRSVGALGAALGVAGSGIAIAAVFGASAALAATPVGWVLAALGAAIALGIGIYKLQAFARKKWKGQVGAKRGDAAQAILDALLSKDPTKRDGAEKIVKALGIKDNRLFSEDGKGNRSAVDGAADLLADEFKSF